MIVFSSLFRLLVQVYSLTTMLDDLQNAGLKILHDSVSPETCVAIEVSGESLVAGEVKDGIAIGQGFEAIFAVEDVEVAASDGDVLVEGGRWNVGGVGADGKGETVFWLPCGDSLNEEQAALETGVANAANALVRKRGLNGTGESDRVCPGGLELRGRDGGNALDVLPDRGGRSVDADFALHCSGLERGVEVRFGRSQKKGKDREAEGGGPAEPVSPGDNASDNSADAGANEGDREGHGDADGSFQGAESNNGHHEGDREPWEKNPYPNGGWLVRFGVANGDEADDGRAEKDEGNRHDGNGVMGPFVRDQKPQ